MPSQLAVIQGKSRPDGFHCKDCVYQPTGVRLVPPTISGEWNGVSLIGDSPWTEEVLAGRGFAGASGRWLDAILAKRGLSRVNFDIANSYWCKPPSLGMNDDPEKYPDAQLAAAQCAPYLDSYIQTRRPKVIVPLGKVALSRLTGLTDIQNNNGYVIPTRYNVPAVPTFHPSGILQGKHNLTIAFILSLARALEVADSSYQPTRLYLKEDPPPSYLSPSTFATHPQGIPHLMVDIETPKSLAGDDEEAAEDDPSYEIQRMGFSLSAWEGCSFPFEGDYIHRAKAIVANARRVYFWNKVYDLPRLRAAGFTFRPDVEFIDAMWAWHWLYSDLPKTLAFAAPFFYSGPAWKHLGTQRPAFYNACDNAIQMGVMKGVEEQLKKEGRWDRFWSHCVKVDPIYVRMGGAGVKVDKPARAEFMGALSRDAKASLLKVQELLPPSLVKYDLSFKELKPPKINPERDSEIVALFKGTITVTKEEVNSYHADGTPVLLGDGSIMQRPQYRRWKPFNPNSDDQLYDLFSALKITPPKKRGEDRETTEAKYLKRFAKKHPIFKHIIDYKQRGKLISTYNWPLDELDRAHTTYGFAPSTLRSSSRNVNLGNIPKRQELARLFRKLLIAEKGCKLIEVDRSAIEAVLVGYWAKSPEYIKLAKAGVHSYLVSHILGEPVPWEVISSTSLPELQKLLKGFKKKAGIEIYEGCKRCIHGSNYLLSPFGMHDEYEEFFPTEAAAAKFQGIYLGSPAGKAVRAFHKATLEEVHSKKYLDNSFEYRHYFYGPIYKWSKRRGRWEVDHEGDAKRAIAFRPQSDAAAIQREDLLSLDRDYPWFSKEVCFDNLEGEVRLPTYDSLVLESKEGNVNRGIDALVRQFSKPIPELDNLTIGFEVKVGENLEEMEEVKL